jgi:hypothetical protein
MSTTYYGTLDSNPVNLSIQPGQAFPTDRQGTLVEIDALPTGAAVDNIFYFNSPTAGLFLKRVFDGPVRAAHCGIYADGTDQTTKLQTALNHPDITEIVFDYSETSPVVINGSLSVPSNKVLSFKNGNYLTTTAAGSVSGQGLYDAAEYTKVFDGNIAVSGIHPARNVATPFHFGAAGNNSADDSPAIQRLFNYLYALRTSVAPPLIIFPAARYFIATAINLPLNGFGTRFIEISGYGATLRTSTATSIFRRMPADSTQSGQCISDWIGVIKGFTFQGNSTAANRVADQKALELGACYSWVIEDCTFSSLDKPVEIYFGLNCTLRNLRFNQQTHTGILGRHGNWSGASPNNSAFNANRIEKCRFFNGDNSYTSLHLLGADQTVVRECISEGANPQYNFVYDDNNSSGVVTNTFEDIWLESTGGQITTNTGFYIKFRGTLFLKNIQRIYPNRLLYIDPASQGDTVLVVDGLPYLGNLPTTTTFLSSGGTDLTGKYIKFVNLGPGGQAVSTASNWEGGVGPRNLITEYGLGRNEGLVHTFGAASYRAAGDLSIGGRQAQSNLANRWVDFTSGINFPTDATYNIGGNTTNERPNRVSALNYRVATNGVYGFGDNITAAAESLSRPASGVLRLNATGAVDLPAGTTAQRPTGLPRSFRYNSELNTIEWYNGTAWVSPLVQGSGVQAAIRTLAANASFTAADCTLLVDTTAGNVTITVNPALGKIIGHIKKIAGANTVTITPASGTIDGAASHSFSTLNETVSFHSDGVNVYII